jgi:hypothetical protein
MTGSNLLVGGVIFSLAQQWFVLLYVVGFYGHIT